MIEQNGALDLVDERDYDVKKLLGVDTAPNLPSSVFLKDKEIQNQAEQEITRMGCVFYAGSSVSNTMNHYNDENTYISGLDLSKIAIDKGLLDIEKGAYISSSPKLLKELGYIKTYARARDVEEIKLALFRTQPVQTGSNKIDWKKTRNSDDKIAVISSGSAHSFFICGYDDEKQYFICENSYGENSYDHGYFYLNYSDYDSLFNSQYIMTDTPKKNYDEQILKDIDLEGAKEAYKKGLWNGLNPRQGTSRQESATMDNNIIEYLKEYINKRFAKQ